MALSPRSTPASPGGATDPMQPLPQTTRQIDEVGAMLFQALGANAVSIEAYGSAAGDEWAPLHSDINFFIALRTITFSDLRLIGTMLAGEAERRRLRFATPLVVQPDFLDCAGDSYPIELADMRLRHRHIAGEELLAGLRVPALALRTAAEREARTCLLRLHSLAIHRPPDPDVREVLAHLVSALIVICSALLDAPAMTLPRQLSLLQRLQDRTGVVLDAFRRLYEMRHGRRPWPEDLDLERFLDELIGEMEALVRAIDAHRV